MVTATDVVCLCDFVM